jgi:hypothetical protein
MSNIDSVQGQQGYMVQNTQRQVSSFALNDLFVGYQF